MRSWSTLLVTLCVAIVLAAPGCGSAAPSPAATQPPAAQTKATEPAKAPEATKAPAAQPTPAPIKAASFPTKGQTITIQVPFAAGGGTDLAARVVAPLMEKDLGTTVQVVNKPGAGTQIGMTELVKAKPDGYNIAYTNLPTILTTYLDADRKAIYTRKDFQPIANHTLVASALCVGANSSYKTVKELVDAAKAKPGSIKMGTDGRATSAHLSVLKLQQAAGVTFSQVHFDGGAPALTALLGGHTDASFQTIPQLPGLTKDGQVRVLGIAEKQEHPTQPGVKTLQAQGLDVVTSITYGLSAPAGTPKDVVNILANSIKKATETPEYKAKMAEMGFDPMFQGPDEYASFWDDYEKQVIPLVELSRQ